MFENVERQKDENLNGISREIMEYESKMVDFHIESDGDFGAASELLKAIKKKLKDILAVKKRITQPLKDYINGWNNDFKVIENRANEIKDKLDTEIFRYNKIKEAERQRIAEEERLKEIEKLKDEQDIAEFKAELSGSKAEEKKGEHIEKKIDKLEMTEAIVKPTYTFEHSSINIRKTWTYEIEDKKQIPAELCSPDHKLIMAKINGGQRFIPGLRVYQKETTVSR